MRQPSALSGIDTTWQASSPATLCRRYIPHSHTPLSIVYTFPLGSRAEYSSGRLVPLIVTVQADTQ